MTAEQIPIKRYLRAAEVIAIGGLAKRNYALDANGGCTYQEDKAVKFCLIGAINFASHRPIFKILSQLDDSRVSSALRGRLGKAEDIHVWNDRICRTAVEVSDLLIAIAYNPYGFDDS